MYGFPAGDMENCPEPDTFIDDGDIMTACGQEFVALFTPGHAPGHLCFYSKANNIVLAGDTVMAGGIGRTDLPGGSQTVLFASIKSKILSLSDETRILSGHGPDTTVGHERATNPYVAEIARKETA